MEELPLDSFWSEGTEPRDLRDPGIRPPAREAALRRLARPDLVIRGRNLATLLAPAYAAFARRTADSD